MRVQEERKSFDAPVDAFQLTGDRVLPAAAPAGYAPGDERPWIGETELRPWSVMVKMA